MFDIVSGVKVMWAKMEM